jgi:hypothetical protein
MQKLAIVGSGPNTREQAPFDDKYFDIWAFNEAPMDDWCKRWDAAFQLHAPEIYTGHNVKHPDYWRWLQRERGHTIYMQARDERVPDSVTYPLDDVLTLGGRRLMGMSMCYAVGLALLMGYQHIEVWGVELSYTEYQYGADAWRYWVGLATGKLGADHMILHCGEQMFTGLLYGYEGAFAIDEDYFRERVTYLDGAWRSADKNLHGVRDKLMRLITNQRCVDVPDVIKAYETASMTCGEAAGALAEAERYLSFAERAADRGGYEYAAAKAQADGEEKRVLMYHTGGMAEYVYNVWRQTKSKQAEQQLCVLLGSLSDYAYQAGTCHGAYTENIGYILRYDDLAKANGQWIEPAQITQPEMMPL